MEPLTASTLDSIKLIHEWVAIQAEQSPDSTALVMDEQSVTYGQLEKVSNRIARALQEGGCNKGDRVAILLPKSSEAIAAILGVLKAGCIYVPLDASSPTPRLAKMLLVCEPKCLLASVSQNRLVEDLLMGEPTHERIKVGWSGGRESAFAPTVEGFSLDDLDDYSDGPLENKGVAGDPAYIMFTSGSTGQPKGVTITHSNVVSFIRWAVEYFELGPQDKVSGHPPLYFDMSVFDIFGAFASGAQLNLVSNQTSILPHKLVEFISESALTQWFSVPSVLTFMAKYDVLKGKDFPSLKRLIWCGEELSTPVLRYFMERLPEVSFTNLYGPTEATIASSYYTVPSCPKSDDAEIPLGVPCCGEELLVLDDNLEQVSEGEIGDLYIKGVGVSPGYWRDAEKTEAVFLSDKSSERMYKTGDLARRDADGLFYFHGRADSQIKSRGYRIELGEIEVLLRALPSITEAAVVAASIDAFRGSKICAAYVPVPGVEISPVEIRKTLRKSLPLYMLPSDWVSLDNLPYNANGKIDRPKLRDMFERDEVADSALRN